MTTNLKNLLLTISAALTAIIVAIALYIAQETPPTATISVTPGTISEGQEATLTWETSDAETVTINGVAKAVDGSEQVSPPVGETTYTLVATGQGGEVTAADILTVEQLPQPPPGQLVQPSDLAYLGAYKLPVESGWTYGYERRIHFADGKVFVTGTDVDLKIAELTPPATLGSGAYSGLPEATTVQPLASLTGRIANWGTSGLDRLGGICKLTDGRLCVSFYEMYDANSGAANSHVLLDGTLAAGTVTPLRTLTGAPHAGYVGGHMQRVPAEHQAKLGASYLTGQGSISILARTSYGFSLFGFDPAALTSGDTAATPLLYYNVDHPLGPFDGQSSVWNSTCKFGGFAVVKGSVLFFGRLGTGPAFYGVPQSTDPQAPNYDPAIPGNGFHAYPYRYQVWAYDVSDFEAVRLGTLQPYEPQPYAVWELPIPNPWPARWLGGVGYDEATNQITVCQQDDGGDNGGWPIFHVFQVN